MLFDIDDTLVDHEAAVRTSILDHLRDVGLPAGEAEYRRWIKITDEVFARYLSGELSLVDQRRERVRQMLERALSDAEADDWLVGLIARFEACWTIFADVRPALDALAGRPLGVVTNLDADYQREKLRAVGLAAYFRCLVGADGTRAPKPDPVIFHDACSMLGTSPHETAYVGDRLDVDAAGAAAAGLVAFWLDRRGAKGDATEGPVDLPPGVRRVESLAEMVSLLGCQARG